VNHGSPEFSIPNRDKPPWDFVTDADIQANNRHFPLREVDRGARLGLTSGGRVKIGFEISGFSVEGDGNRKSAARGKLKSIMAVPENSGFFAEGEFKPEAIVRGKLKEVVAGKEGTHVCGAVGA
jgi:hypothetical protein